MPSYRVTLVVGVLRPGVEPQRVLPAARAAVLEVAVVEAADVQVVSGQARIVVRFTAEDAGIAVQVGGHAASVVGTLASVDSWRVTERVGARWDAV